MTNRSFASTSACCLFTKVFNYFSSSADENALLFKEIVSTQDEIKILKKQVSADTSAQSSHLISLIRLKIRSQSTYLYELYQLQAKRSAPDTPQRSFFPVSLEHSPQLLPLSPESEVTKTLHEISLLQEDPEFIADEAILKLKKTALCNYGLKLMYQIDRLREQTLASSPMPNTMEEND